MTANRIDEAASWPSDYATEGKYECFCGTCARHFHGAKNRRQCAICFKAATDAASSKGNEAPAIDWSLYERTGLGSNAMPPCVLEAVQEIGTAMRGCFQSQKEAKARAGMLPTVPKGEPNMVLGMVESSVLMSLCASFFLNQQMPIACALDFHFHVGLSMQKHLDIWAIQGLPEKKQQEAFATKREEIVERLASRQRDVVMIENELKLYDEAAGESRDAKYDDGRA